MSRVMSFSTDSPNPLIARSVGVRIDDGQVAAVDELLDAERLDAELERAPAVGRRVEEDVRMQRRTRTSTPREPSRSSWNGPPPARIEKTHEKSGQSCLAARQPGEVRGLHLRRVDGERAPPAGGAARGTAPPDG